MQHTLNFKVLRFPVEKNHAIKQYHRAEIGHQESIAEKEGMVYCKYTAPCNKLKRTSCSNLVVRTTVAEFADADG